MTYQGATGETRTAMRETLRFRLDEPTLHDGYEELAAELAECADADTQQPMHLDEDVEKTPFTLQTAFVLTDEQRALSELRALSDA